MLDMRFIQENKQKISAAIKHKGVDLDVDELLEAAENKKKFLQKVERVRAKKNKLSRQLARTVPEKEKLALSQQALSLKKELSLLEKELARTEKLYQEYMAHVPNVYSEDTPIGKDEHDNKEIERHGTIPEFDFPVQDHITLGKKLDILDVERGVKVAGFRGYFLKNEGALMHMAVLNLAVQKLVEKGFTFMISPTIVKEFALFGSGHFPGDREEIYQLSDFSKEKSKEEKFLVGTSEPSLLAYHARETLNERQLPLRLAALSPCYRREVGSYGKDTKGLYRIHEFYKVEQVVICQNSLEISLQLFEEIKNNALELLNDLNLPHRIVQICTGDMGVGKYKMYDIETWMPSRNSYGETHSNSHLTDWQSRRLDLRYQTTDGKNVYAYTMNNTMVASPRILIALLENNQQADGSVRVPEALQAFVGKKIIEPKS